MSAAVVGTKIIWTLAWGEITRLASSGNIVADLGQGYPDFKGNAAALKSASETLLSSVKENQYSLIHGHEGLRQSLASFYASQYPSGIKFSAENQIVVTSSGTEALFSCMQALIDPGDEVIVFEPFFPWYIPSVRMAGGVPKVITLAPPDFEINAEFVESQISSKTKMIIVNSPHNPTGHVCSLPELQGVCKLAVKHDLMVVSDEVYECFVWGDGMRHHRVCDIKGMEDRTITIGSSSKMFSLTGFRVGWVYGQESLVNAVKACHAYSTCKSKENTFYFVNDETDCAPTPLQVGIENALQNYQAEQSVELSKKFKKNAEILARALLQLNVKCLLPDVRNVTRIHRYFT